MLDTTIKGALELTIAEFNDWALKSQNWSKYDIKHCKGVFTEKLKRNLKVCPIHADLVAKSHFNPELIHILVVTQGIITRIEFSCPSNTRHVYDNASMTSLGTILNTHMTDINMQAIILPLLNGNLQIVINTVIDSINKYKFNV